ncbi:DnaB-like helicase C-terminal domain-containing protein [Thiomonas intermedia]|uniref:DnaB-like helicase C-terminal domain-containing protein n=1 Tax=Thiomonas intermedia TaxID=926 RepID=UPI0009A54F71|nr:DnaB-like helicase C-terminal domain-containing protein [Thiomonas intermedia]
MIIGASDLELADYMAEPDFSAFVRTADDLLDDIKRAFNGETAQEQFATLGWPKARDLLAFRPGEITLWAGSNGSRKSMLAGQVILDVAQQGYRSLTISLEMSARETLKRMFRQAAAVRWPSPADCDLAAAVMRDRAWIFDHVGSMSADRLCAVLRWSRKTLNIEHVLVDSMTKVVNGDDDYNGQKAFINQMTEVAKETGLHLHVVVHTRKPSESGPEKVPSKWDIKGSSSVTDLAHNVVTLWRNRPKEAEADKARAKGLQPPETDAPDQILDVQKQRNGEFEGRILLWFDRGSMQFLQHSAERPLAYVRHKAAHAHQQKPPNAGEPFDDRNEGP